MGQKPIQYLREKSYVELLHANTDVQATSISHVMKQHSSKAFSFVVLFFSSGDAQCCDQSLDGYWIDTNPKPLLYKYFQLIMAKFDVLIFCKRANHL